MRFLKPHEAFPPVETTDENGLLAIGGDLSVARLTEAYQKGVFPWYDAPQPVLWWSPDPRMVLFPENLKVSKSMKTLLRKNAFQVSFNQDFEAVIQNCATVARKNQGGTWITQKMQDAYLQLHKKGLAHSVEVWQENQLVGGLYGIYLKEKKIFCGESMFSKTSNASKYGFIKWVEKLTSEGIKLIDCQMYTPHLESLGATEIPRKEFLKYLG
ncbi:MAG TPA: leucyl/phenylalanyl-tRNA--protein transferase [Salinimicrobium sp.]|nr:leucyl/phenylalanyl-tRNA--protein transferase [Salinimicrobium sp.]